MGRRLSIRYVRLTQNPKIGQRWLEDRARGVVFFTEGGPDDATRTWAYGRAPLIALQLAYSHFI
jgi:hypothetical protein